jgi:hypothetical protein
VDAISREVVLWANPGDPLDYLQGFKVLNRLSHNYPVFQKKWGLLLFSPLVLYPIYDSEY